MDSKTAKQAIAMLQDYIILYEANKKVKTTTIEEQVKELHEDIKKLVNEGQA